MREDVRNSCLMMEDEVLQKGRGANTNSFEDPDDDVKSL
jgi:hypothetical protein